MFQPEFFTALSDTAPEETSISVATVDESTQTPIVEEGWSLNDSSPMRQVDWSDFGSQTDPKLFGEKSVQTVPEPTKTDNATQTSSGGAADGSTQTEERCFADQEVQAEPEGLLVSGVPFPVCRISRIAAFLEKFGSLSDVSVSRKQLLSSVSFSNQGIFVNFTNYKTTILRVQLKLPNLMKLDPNCNF